MADTTQTPELIPEPDAAHLLGVSPGTLKAARLHRLPSNPLRDLPHVRIGRTVRYRRSDIESWIEANTVQPSGGAA
jgi:predicted DNA-binding transcriptional regulator AlpA